MSTKNNMLRVRFSDKEWDDLKRLSESANMTMSEVVRNHLGQVIIRNQHDEKQRIAMLNRINANLNMIARWVNTHKSAADSVEVVAHLMAIDRAVKELARRSSDFLGMAQEADVTWSVT